MVSWVGSTQMNGTRVMERNGITAFSNMPPFQVLNFVVALTGIYPSRS